MGETGYSRRNLGLAGQAKNPINPANLAVILRQPPRFKIRADYRRFPILSLPPRPGLASRDHNYDLDFFHNSFLPEPDYGLVSVRRARYRFVGPFSIPADSPRNKRGRSRSGNRGPRFENRAETGRFALHVSAFFNAPRTRTVQGAPKILERVS